MQYVTEMTWHSFPFRLTCSGVTNELRKLLRIKYFIVTVEVPGIRNYLRYHMGTFLATHKFQNINTPLTHSNHSKQPNDIHRHLVWSTIQRFDHRCMISFGIIFCRQESCCAAYNYTDYSLAKNWNSTGLYYNFNGTARVPISCCRYSGNATGKFPPEHDEFIDITGCLEGSEEFINTKVLRWENSSCCWPTWCCLLVSRYAPVCKTPYNKSTKLLSVMTFARRVCRYGCDN